MYSLREALQVLVGSDRPIDGWDGSMYCMEMNATMLLRTNETQGFITCYAFMLVDRGG